MPDITPDLTDELLAAIAAHLPPKPLDHNPKGGRPRVDDLSCLRGVVYLLREGCRWQRIPVAGTARSSSVSTFRRVLDWVAFMAALGVRVGVFLSRVEWPCERADPDPTAVSGKFSDRSPRSPYEDAAEEPRVWLQRR